jgi:Domain of unknown function (DUF4258)
VTEISKRWNPTRHAQERMCERKITSDEIDAVLAAPDYTTPGKNGATCYWRTVNGRRIRVYAAPSRNPNYELHVRSVAAPDEDEDASRAEGN